MDNKTENFLDFLMERMEAAIEYSNHENISDSQKVDNLRFIVKACKRRIREHLESY